MGIDIEGTFQGRGLNCSSLWSEDLRPSNGSAGRVSGYFTEVSCAVGVKCSWFNNALHCSIAVCW